MKKNINIRELERWLKSSLKNKVSIDSRSVIAYLMMGFAGLMISTIANAGWVNKWGEIKYWPKASGNADAFTYGWTAEENVTGEGSVMITKGDRINNKLQNSVVIGYGGGVPSGSGINAETQRLKIDVENGGHGIVAIGSVRVLSNPHGIGSTGNGGQGVAIGNDVTSTSQAVAIGNNTYALGNASIAVGSDDISTYRDKITNYDYKNYLQPLYNNIDSSHTSYGIGNGAANDIYSPNVAGGTGSIAIGSRTMAYKDGSTALGTLAYALGKGATALGTQSRAEGEGSIAVGNKTRNFANQALAIGNDSQILNVGGTAVGLRARSGGEGSIAIGTDVYANVIMNTDPSIKSKLVDREMGTKSTTITDVENTVKDNKAINPELTKFHDIEGIIKTTANQKNAIVIGTRSVATGDNAMALGRGAFAMANNAFGIGSYSYADHVNAMAIGTSSRALAENSITVGAGSVATANAKNATVLGTNSGVGGENSSVVGSNSEAFSKNTLIYGNETKVGELNSTNNTDNNIAIGNNISIGSGVTNSMAYGPNTRIGNTNRAVNSNIDNSTAFGSGATIERLYNGQTADKMNNAQAKSAADANNQFMYTGNNAMAIGNYSRAVLENSVALGVKSDTDYTYSDLLQPGWTARGSIAVPTSGQTGVISVGSKGQERRIVNVASGYRDTDAVNVIQLRTLEETVTNKVDSIESGMHYLSVNKEGADYNGEKGSKKVTQLIEREKNFNQYVRYRIQQIQLEARQRWQGEKFNEESLNEINRKVAELGADSEITRVASALATKTISPTVPSGKSAAQAYKDLVTELETIRYELVEKDRTDLTKIDGKYQKGKYNELLAGEDIAALKKVTNYSNEGGQGDDSLAVGFRALAVKDESNVSNKINAARAIAMGYKAKTSSKESISIGDESNVAVAAERGIAVGYKAQAEGARSLSLGSKSKSQGELSIAIGSNEHGKSGTTASGKQSIAFGNAAKATAEKAMAMGPEVEATAEKAIAIGSKDGNNVTKASGKNDIAIGSGTQVSGGWSVGIGSNVKATKNTTIAIGDRAEATANNAVALGAAAKANIANSVALGQGVTTTASAGAGYLTNQAFSDSGKVVSVGQRRINQLADGKADDDAVTVAQLKALENKTLTTDNAKITIAPDQNGTQEFAMGSTINLKTNDAWTIGTERYVGDNLETYKKSNGDILIGFKEEPKFKTLKLNNGASGSQDLTLSADNAGNLNVGSKKITGVADGTISATSTDAINGSQLNTVKNTADTAKTTADTAKNTADTAKATADTAQAKADDVANKLTTLGDKKIGFNGNDGTKVEKKLGEDITIKGDDSSITTTAGNDAITIKVKDSGISTAKLADGAVTEAKLANGLLSKINAGNTVASNNMRLAGDPTTAGGAATKTNNVALNNTGGVEFAINGKENEIVTKASGTKVEIGLSETLKTKLAKLDNLDDNANNKYATKDETANKDLGNVTTDGKNVIKDQARKAVIVEAGTGIAVTPTTDETNHTTKYTVALDTATTEKINNIGKVADGKDGKDAKPGADGTAGTTPAAGTHGLTGKDGLNGKDLTTKVNALRNGEAGTVVFTDAQGNRLVKANDGNYYLTNQVDDKGEVITPAGGTAPTAVAETDIELRVVTSKGETKTTSIKLSNIADGKIAANSKDAINGSQLNDVASKLGLTVGADGKTLTLPTITGLKDATGTAGASPTSVVDGLNKVIGKVNEGIKYNGDLGTEDTQYLGSKVTINRTGRTTQTGETVITDGTEQYTKYEVVKDTTTNQNKIVTTPNQTRDVTYVGDNLITKYTKDATGNGKFEIGLKENPTFKQITADHVDTKTITFDDGKGNKLTVGPSDDGKSLIVGDKEIATKKDVILKLTKDGTNDAGKVDLSTQKLQVVGENGVTVDIANQKVTVSLDNATKNKLENLATDPSATYATKTELDKKANKAADNLTDADVTAWKEKLGLSKAVSGTGNLSIDAATKNTAGTETTNGKATVKLDGTENFKMIGTDGVTVAATGKEITFGLDQDTKDKINNVGKSTADGRDGKDATDGTNGANGTHGLTGKDGLNGKDLTTKVNALRNGEAGTVVYTDAEGNRLVKANDGKYYKPEFVAANGDVQANTAGQVGVGIENPELRVVNANGETIKPTTLNNLASGLGLDTNKVDGTTYGKPISDADAKTVVSGLLTKTDGLNKAVTVGDLQALAQAGLDFEGNTGTVHKTLGSTLKIIGKDITGFDNTKFTTDYSTDNVATNVKNDGTVEIGFKKSPTFTKVKADEVEADKVKITKELIFDDGHSNPTTIVAGDGKGALLINGKKVATSVSAPVLYVDENNNVVEKGLDDKLYKSDDLKNKRYDVATNKYYAETDFENGHLRVGATPVTLTEVPANKIKHALAALDNNSVTNAKVLTNVADGKIDATSKDAINGSQIKNVLDKIGVTTDADGNVVAPTITKIKDDKGEDPTGTAPTTLKDGLNAVIDKVNKGIKYNGDLGTEGTQQLGTVFNVNKAGSTITEGTGTTSTNYVGSNLITRYTKNNDGSGKLEIGFKESPTFKDVTAENIKASGTITGKDGKFENLKVTEKITTKEIVFKDGSGNNLTLVNGKDGNLYINGVAVPSAANAPVIYTNEAGDRVELGQDGKVYEPKDLKGLTYVKADATKHIQAGYYADDQFEKENGTFKKDDEGNKILITNATSKDLTDKEYKGTVIHKLSAIKPGDTNARILRNVADGVGNNDAVNIKQFKTVSENTIKLTTDGTTGNETTAVRLDKTGGISFGIKGENGIETSAAGTDVTVKLKDDYKTKLDNLDTNANDKYANKDASNLNNLSDTEKERWRTAIGLGNAVSGTGNLSIDAATLGTETGATETANGKATVKLDGTQNFKLLGTDGITVKGSNDEGNKTLTFGLDETTKAAIKNIGKSVSDGRDGKDATNGTNGANGTHGLTGKDGLNGKDLTTKVNALRNGEAGTVVFTDSQGNRLVKANDGKYYKPEFVSETGEPQEKDGVQPTAVVEADIELRVVDSKGETKNTSIKLSNIADGKIGAGSKDAINGSQIKDVLDKLGVEIDSTTGAIKQPTITAIKGKDGKDGAATTSVVAGLNKIIETVNSGIKYDGDLGTEATQQLGSKFSVVRAAKSTVAGYTPLTETDGANMINYVGDNVITKYTLDTATGNGKLEIGFKESPTFKDVTATGNITGKDGKFENLKVTEKITTKEIVFKDGSGNNLTLVTGKDGNLYINGVAVPTAESAPVIYTNTDGERVEKGQDGKIYKPEDIKNLTYVKARAESGTVGTADYKPAITGGYYADDQFEVENGVIKKDAEGNKVLKDNATPKDLTSKEYTDEVLHKLSPITGTGAKRLTNVADGVGNNDAVNMKQLNEVKDGTITFKGDTATDTVSRKLGETLNITGNGIKVTKNKAGDGLELSISKGKVETVNVADKAITSAKLAKDARTMVYIDQDGDPVELAADGKLYKAKDLVGKTYVEVKNGGVIDTNKTGFYNNTDIDADGALKDTANKLVTPNETVPVKHALNGYHADTLNVTTKSVLTNVGEGTIAANSTDAINGAQFHKLTTNTIKLTADGVTTGGVTTDKETTALNLNNNGGISFGIKGVDGITTTANGTDVTVKLSDTYKTKLDNLDENANDKYANKDASNLNNLSDAEKERWRTAIGLGNAVSGTGNLSIDAATLGTETGATETANGKATVKLDGTQNFKLLGTDGITVKGSNDKDNKTLTFGLDKATTDKLKNITAVSDGKDGKATNGTDGSNGSHGLTGKDGLNGKDLTTKVNALRNGEAGTVVYTDAEGNRLVKANDGKYYKPEFVAANGDVQANAAGQTGVGIENPELRVVNADGSTTTPNKLTNIANGKIDATSKDAINGSQIKDVLDKLGVETDTNGNIVTPTITALNKADGNKDTAKTTLKDGLNAVIGKVNEGIKYKGDLGTEGTQQLGTVFNVVRATVGTPLTETVTGTTSTTINYVGDNLITQYTRNTDGSGKLEIGFKESPTFKDVTADKVKAGEVEAGTAKVKKELTFDDGTGKPTTIVAGDGKGSLLINGKKVATSESAPVLYTDATGNIVEKALDGKIYKVADLEGKRYDKGTNKYYADNQFENGVLKADAVAANLQEVLATDVKHALAKLNDNAVTGGSVLTNVAAGTADTDAVNVGQLNAVKESPITFQGDKATDTVTRKLGETLKITGDGIKVRKNATNDGLVLSIDQGKVQTKNVADQAVTSAKLAQDARTVVYVTQNNEPVELGADNKLYKSADLQGKTYIVSTDPTIQSGYYADGDLNADKTAPLAGKTPATLTAVNPDPTVAGGQKLKHALNGYIPGGTDVTTNSVLTNVGEGTADNDAVNVGQLNKVKNNTIKLTADGVTSATGGAKTNTETTALNLDKTGGISFGIKGADGIETTATGTDVTVKLSKAVTDKLNNITAVSDGKDGKATNGTDGSNGSHGLTGKDGLNGKDLTTKVNALRNGEAGTVVFTDAEGNRLVKANDGKYYPVEDVEANGNVKPGVDPNRGITNPELRVVNANGETTTVTTLNNIANGLKGLTNGTAAVAKETAGEVVKNLLTQTDGLNKAVNVGDLQALAQAGLNFTGNSGNAHAPLSTIVNVAGQGTTATGFVGASGNINVVASEDTTTADKIAKLEIQLAEALKGIKSIQNGDTKITLDKDNGVKVDGTNGGKVVVNGKDGTDGVTITGTDGTNGSSIAVNGKDGKDGVTITGTNGTDGSSIVVNGKDGQPGVTINGGNGTNGKDATITFTKDGANGTGSITGLKDPELNDDGTPKDKTAATTVNYVTNQIEGAKTEITNKINNLIDGGMTYKGNSGDDVKVELKGTLNIKGEGNYTGTDSASGNIAVVGDLANKTLEIKLNKDLKNIETISNGDTKITLDKDNGVVKVDGKDGGKVVVNGKDGTDGVTITGTNGTDGSSIVVNGKDGANGKDSVTIKGGDGTNGSSIAVNGKDGKDGVTITGTNGTDGSSIVVNGKDGQPGVTINGGNGTNGKDATITFTKDGANGTGSITGLKDPELNTDGTPKDKTAATTVNYVTNQITNVTDKINDVANKMDKGLNFVGNDPTKVVNAKLDGIVSIKGEGTIATGIGTAANNITVEKDTTAGTTGLVVKLADKLTGMTGFETKEENGKKVTIDKDGISLTTKATTGTPATNLKLGTDGTITGVVAKPDDKTSVATVEYVNSKIGSGITFGADNGNNQAQELGTTLKVKAATETITANAKDYQGNEIKYKDQDGTDKNVTANYRGNNLITSYNYDTANKTGTISVAMSERPEFAAVTVGKGDTKATLDGEKGSLEFNKTIETGKDGKPIVYANNDGKIVTYKDENGKIQPIYKQIGKGTISGLKDVDYLEVDGNRVAIDRTQAVNAGYVDDQLGDVRTRINNNTTRITELSTESRAGIAGVAAMANIPQINDAGSNKYNISVGIGKHRGETAYALGISGVSDDGRVVYKASAALDSQNKVTAGLGLGYQFGKRDIEASELDRFKAQMALLQTDSTRKFEKLEREQQRMREEQEAIKATHNRMQEAIIAIDKKTDNIDKLNQMKMNQLEERINQKVEKIDSLNQLKINQINKEMEKVKNKLKIYK